MTGSGQTQMQLKNFRRFTQIYKDLQAVGELSGACLGNFQRVHPEPVLANRPPVVWSTYQRIASSSAIVSMN